MPENLSSLRQSYNTSNLITLLFLANEKKKKKQKTKAIEKENSLFRPIPLRKFRNILSFKRMT